MGQQSMSENTQPFNSAQLLDSLTTSVIVLDDQLQVRYANPAAEMLLAATTKRLAQLPVQQWLTPQQDETEALRQALASGHSYTRREARLVALSGAQMTVDYSVSPQTMHGQGGLLIEMQPRDRLLRIEREEELLAHHATTRHLIRGMAHEIQNPLGGIRGAAQLLERQLVQPEQQEYTQVIIAEVDRLKNLLERMLGPRQRPRPAQVNIHALLERVCALVTAESHGQIQLLRDYDPSIPEFIGDGEQLLQAILNIVRNAMQALTQCTADQSPAVGPDRAPAITLRTRTRRQLTLGSEKHRLAVRLQVIDNGPGIPETLRNSIFYPMISGRPEGSGLGLSIAQSIINQHHGLIEYHSVPGRTCFSLFIPLELSDDDFC